jgi:hypothetical protein
MPRKGSRPVEDPHTADKLPRPTFGGQGEEAAAEPLSKKSRVA